MTITKYELQNLVLLDLPIEFYKDNVRLVVVVVVVNFIKHQNRAI